MKIAESTRILPFNATDSAKCVGNDCDGLIQSCKLEVTYEALSLRRQQFLC